MTISKVLLDRLLKVCQRLEDLLGDAGLMKELKIRLMELGELLHVSFHRIQQGTGNAFDRRERQRSPVTD